MLTGWLAQTEVISKFRGFGHKFERPFTIYSSDLGRATGHYRIVNYTLFGLKILLRFEVDGYDGDYGPSKPKEGDDLDARINSLRIGSEAVSTLFIATST